ncbi:hypothetical protein PN483_13990, partial [Nodularia spumigena CS-591/04]
EMLMNIVKEKPNHNKDSSHSCIVQITTDSQVQQTVEICKESLTTHFTKVVTALVKSPRLDQQK